METYRTLALTLSFLLTFELSVAVTPVESDAAAVSPVIASGRSEEASQLVDWAVGRFAAAGLVLPPVAIELHEDKVPCGGHLGLTYNTPGSATLHLCTPGDGRSVVDRLTLIHELAHVWVAQHVDQASRRQFMEVHGLDSWWDPQDGWEYQGVEWAAETLAWAVHDEGVRMIGEVDDDPVALRRGYGVLTGRAAPTSSHHGHSLAHRAQALSAREASPADVAAVLDLRSLSLAELREAWKLAATRRGLPTGLGNWTRSPGGSVVRTSITEAVDLVVVVEDAETIEAVTVVGTKSGQCEAYDTLLTWTLLLEALDPDGVNHLDGDVIAAALVERHDHVRGIVHLQEGR
jgi:hypothetical protein